MAYATRSDTQRGIRDPIGIVLFGYKRNPLPPIVVAAAAPRPFFRRNPMPAASQPMRSRGRY